MNYRATIKLGKDFFSLLGHGYNAFPLKFNFLFYIAHVDICVPESHIQILYISKSWNLYKIIGNSLLLDFYLILHEHIKYF